MSILDPLEPYLIWIKLAIAAALLAGAGFAGWHVRGWQCDAEKTAAVTAVVTQMNADIDDYKAELVKQEKFKDGQRLEYNAKVATLTKANSKLKEDIRNANLNTVTPASDATAVPADEPFNHEFVLRWNQPIADLVASGVMSDPGLYLPPADTTVARVTRADVLDQHSAIVQLYGDCKMKQDKVIETFSKGASP